MHAALGRAGLRAWHAWTWYQSSFGVNADKPCEIFNFCLWPADLMCLPSFSFSHTERYMHLGSSHISSFLSSYWHLAGFVVLFFFLPFFFFLLTPNTVSIFTDLTFYSMESTVWKLCLLVMHTWKKLSFLLKYCWSINEYGFNILWVFRCMWKVTYYDGGGLVELSACWLSEKFDMKKQKNK